MPEVVHFYSSPGLRLEADLYLPPGASEKGQVPGVVVCLGFGSVREQVRRWGESLSASGFAVLVTDYRGFGGSEGERGRVVPLEQVEDLRAGLTYLAQRPEVDPKRLSVLGISFGGAHAIYVGGVDRRVRCVISIVGFGDGERHMRSMRRHYEWLAFQERLAQDRIRRVLTGQSERVHPDEILIRDPEAARWRAEMEKRFPNMRFETTLECAEKIVEYRPESVLPYRPPKPLLIVHAENDALIPVDEAYALFDRAEEPKRLVVLPGVAHHAIHESPTFERVVEVSVQWMKEHLGRGVA